MREPQDHAGIEGIVQAPLARKANNTIVQRGVAQFLECSPLRKRTQLMAGVTNRSRLIGVSEWETKIVEALPDNLKGSLPTVEEIEAELAEYPQIASQGPRRKR